MQTPDLKRYCYRCGRCKEAVDVMKRRDHQEKHARMDARGEEEADAVPASSEAA